MPKKFDDIRIDEEGEQRCWNCGGRHFTLKRSKRAKIGIGVSAGVVALMRPKHKKCQSCGVYNVLGNVKQYSSPKRAVSAEIPEGDPDRAVWELTNRGWRCIAHGRGKCPVCRTHTQLPGFMTFKDVAKGDLYPSDKHPRRPGAPSRWRDKGEEKVYE